MFAMEGNARLVAILAFAQISIEQTDWDNWNGGTAVHTLYLRIPVKLYAQVQAELATVTEELDNRIGPLWAAHTSDWLSKVQILPELSTDDDWQDKARAWLAGDNITNQGRVRSNNIAPREKDGLLFRSQPEINLYSALKEAGVSFAPLPVFVRGGKEYRRIEPDFVVLKDGLMMVIEVDGDTVHQETPIEAHARTTMLEHEGAHIERVSASECDTPNRAAACARRLIQLMGKLKTSRS
jgi:hypothetical protein